MSNYKEHPLYDKHSLDTAMDSLWKFYKSHFLKLFLISLFFALVGSFLSANVDNERLSELMLSQDSEALRAFLKETLIFTIPSVLVSLFGFTTISLYVYSSGTDRLSAHRLIMKSAGYLLTLTIIVIVFIPFAAIVTGIGLLALIIGALFSLLWLTALFLFFTPLLIAEGNNISNTFTRSFRMLHKHFGSNLGWTAVMVVILILLSLLISTASLIPMSGSLINSIGDPDMPGRIMGMARNPLYLLLVSALKALTFSLMPIFGFILYFNAKAWEDDAMEADSPES